jgi:hypothetical protein
MQLNRTIIRMVEVAFKKQLPLLVPLNKSWQFLQQEYNIGTLQGTKLKLTSTDKAELIAIIKQETGFDLHSTSVKQLANKHREQALTITHYEKWAGKAVKSQRIALKTLADKTLRFNQQHYYLPVSGHMDISLEQLTSIEHNCLLIVENYRCFDQIHRITMRLPEQYANPLVIYRGDDYYSERTLRELLDKFTLPVIAMLDIDLQSLLMAMSFAKIVGLMCMSLAELEGALATQGHADLYAKQLPACRLTLNNAEEPIIKNLWQLLQDKQKVWVQEHDLNGEYVLRLMEFES